MSMNSPPWKLEATNPVEDLPKRVDVVILGAEISAMACAYQLAVDGVRVLVLEAASRGDNPGSSLRAAGILVPGLPEPVHRLVHALGWEDCQKLCQLTKRSIQRLKELDCYHSTGVVMAPLSKEETESLATDASVYSTLGWEVETHRPETKMIEKGVGVGLCLPEAGTVNPGTAFQRLEQAAQQAGAHVHYQRGI